MPTNNPPSSTPLLTQRRKDAKGYRQPKNHLLKFKLKFLTQRRRDAEAQSATASHHCDAVALCVSAPLRLCVKNISMHFWANFFMEGGSPLRLCAFALKRTLQQITFTPLLPILCVLRCFWCDVLAAEPWGKDADLAQPIVKQHCVPATKQPLWESMIRFHQDVISPCDGPRSHFLPSSSQYTMDAMRRYGFIKGFTMGCDRLMRENNEEWIYLKHESGLKLNPVR